MNEAWTYTLMVRFTHERLTHERQRYRHRHLLTIRESIVLYWAIEGEEMVKINPWGEGFTVPRGLCRTLGGNPSAAVRPRMA